MGVVARRFINFLIVFTYPYSTCISSFFAAAFLLFYSFLKCFFVLVIIYIERILHSNTISRCSSLVIVFKNDRDN